MWAQRRPVHSEAPLTAVLQPPHGGACPMLGECRNTVADRAATLGTAPIEEGFLSFELLRPTL